MASFFDRLVRSLKREGREVKATLDEVTESLDADLDRKERELHAPPEERLKATIEGIDASDQEYEKLKRDIERRASRGDDG